MRPRCGKWSPSYYLPTTVLNHGFHDFGKQLLSRSFDDILSAVFWQNCHEKLLENFSESILNFRPRNSHNISGVWSLAVILAEGLYWPNYGICTVYVYVYNTSLIYLFMHLYAKLNLLGILKQNYTNLFVKSFFLIVINDNNIPFA